MRSFRSALLLVCACALMLGIAAAQDTPTPRLEAQGALPGAGQTKLPHVVVSAGQAHIAANARRLDANYWAAAADGSFGSPERLGPAEGQPDYSSAAIAATPDGTLYAAWINQPERTIYVRSRPAGGAWSNPTIVVRGAPFPVNVAITAGTAGVFVAWRNPDQPFVFSRLRADQRWTSPQPLSRAAGYNAPGLAAGADRAAIAYTQGEADQLQIYAGLWDGQHFATERITQLNASYADPRIAIAPDGRVVAAWRGIADSGPTSGVFLAERAADGAWPTAQIVGGKVIGPVTPAFDADGGLHLFWIGEAGGVLRLWYAQQPRGGAWSAPVSASVAGGALFNAYGAVGAAASGLRYAHAASEVFIGDRLTAHTFRFTAGGQSRPAATPILAAGATHSSAARIALDFRDVSGAPTEVRRRWGAPPTDADPWQPFGPTLIDAPAGAGRAACQEQRLYTQVRNANGIQEPAAVATIVFDTGVQATLTSHNPDGLPGYARTPNAWLALDLADECSGIAAASLNGASLQFDAAAQRLIPISLAAGEGPQQFALHLTDGLGNSRAYTTTIVYDATAPEVQSDPIELRADPAASVLQTISLRNVRYRDTASAAPWAVAVAAAPAEGDYGSWQTIPLDAHAITQEHDGSLTIHIEVSLAALLPPGTLHPGDYALRARLVDPAGNPAEHSVKATLELHEITYPRLYLPALRR